MSGLVSFDSCNDMTGKLFANVLTFPYLPLPLDREDQIR